MASRFITIRVSAWDAGCLPHLIAGAIGDQERHLRVCADRYSDEAKDAAEAYLKQLHGCLDAVVKARL
jgi:hypothetical protein